MGSANTWLSLGCELNYRERCAVEVIQICLFGRPENVLPLAFAPVRPPVSEYSDWHIKKTKNKKPRATNTGYKKKHYKEKGTN